MIDAVIQLRKMGFTLEASFSVPASGVTGVFGPSGCGKTSLLRAIAGLEPEATGIVRVAGMGWQNASSSMPVIARRVGFVFQDPCLFPHLNVLENLQYARKRVKSAHYQYDINEICDLLQLQDLLQHSVGILSGGQRQRVAIGRALLSSPAMLLMDEPMSALDQSARNQLILILEKIFQQIEIPVFYVSHSSDEIARLAEHLILMERGRITAYGELGEVLGRVDSPLSASDQAFSVIRCTITSHDLPFLTTVESRGGARFQVPRQFLRDNSEVRLRIRARDVSLCLQPARGTSILNVLPATVVTLAKGLEQGSRTVKLDVAGDSLLAQISEHSTQVLQLQPGKAVYAQIKSVSLLN